MIRITCNAKEYLSEREITVAQVFSHLWPEIPALGAFCGGRVLELKSILKKDCELTPITFAHEEGRRIYERSLRFILLLAVHRCYPEARVRIEHSIGFGLYFELEGKRVTQSDTLKIEDTMREIVHEDLPFIRNKWSRQQAIDYFTALGWKDKADLLSYRTYDYFHIYECGGLAEYFYGAMLPSTGMAKAFSLRYHPPGLILQMPSPADPTVPAPYISRPKHMATFFESNYWCEILGCRNAADLNHLIADNKLREFIRINEALHDQSLSRIAEDILRMAARAIFVAGPSSSGKTTTANRLKIHLQVLGLRPVLISMDDFYLNRPDVPLDEHSKPDLESLYALDVPLFRKCIRGLLDGEEVTMPRYDFSTGSRKKEGVKLQITRNQILIIEGIHGLNPALHEGFDPGEICKFYLSELTCLNLDDHNRIRTTDARLLRRIVRDYQFRGTTPEKTLAMWDSVRAGEEKWIFPYQEQADIVFNTALHYELPVLKPIAYNMLSTITPDHPCYFRAHRLIRCLNYFLPAPEDTLNEIPPLSILREFIGGNTLYTAP
ncbi:MAG: nucleoside kinase [Clostridia bacterium]|nr:nucleoside kinase [Clostridia bacterium]